MIETARMLLRPWRDDVAVELLRLFGDPDVRGDRHIPPERIAGFHASTLRQWRWRGFGPWAALDKATGEFIGRLGLDHLDDWPGPDKIEVGFELRKAWWGRGLATEGALAALDFGFVQHGLERIISVTAAAHTRARRVMEKAGLTYRETRYWMRPDVPVVMYAIERSAWEAAQSRQPIRSCARDPGQAPRITGPARLPPAGGDDSEGGSVCRR
jgi:RimJ/RimL family protein N-acetyltransferase